MSYNSLVESLNHCEQAQILTGQYANVQVDDFHAEVEYLDRWIQENSKSSLLIVGQPLSGKKALLCSYMARARRLHPQFYQLSFFRSVTPIYSNVLYKIMVGLRNHFHINQKVEINEEKLRRYFKYWLQITSSYIQREYLGYGMHQKPKIIIVIEGVDLFVDAKGSPVAPSFWLPSEIPSNVKLLLSATSVPSDFAHAVTVLQHCFSRDRIKKMTAKLSNVIKQLYCKDKNQDYYEMKIIDCFIKNMPKFTPKGCGIHAILQQYIEFVADTNLTKDQIKSILYTLVITRKGLTIREIKKIVNLESSQISNFISYFSGFFIEYKGYYLICNQSTRHLVKKIIEETRQKLVACHQAISKALRKESLTFRRLEECVFHLMESESYSQLKEVISKIQNFLLLYTPLSKNLLCQCWVKLEQLQQYDPVFEYNRAVEAFNNHYYPKEQQLYKIIFQLCMFFKEYAEFQNSRTPQFRHPLIKGQADHLQEISIYEELKGLNMVGKCKSYKMKKLQDCLGQKKIDRKGLDQKKKKKQEGQREQKTQMLKKVSGETEKKVRVRQEGDMIEGRKTVKGKDVKEIQKLKDIKQKKVRQDSLKEKKKNIHDKEKDHNKERNTIMRKTKIYTEAIDSYQNSRPSTSDQLSLEQGTIEGIKPIQGEILNVQELNVSIHSNQEKFRKFYQKSMREYLQNYFLPLRRNGVREKDVQFESDESEGEEGESCRQRGERELHIDVEKMKQQLVLKRFREYLEQNYHNSGEEVRYYYYRQWIWLQFPWVCQSVRHDYSTMMRECITGSIQFMTTERQFSLIGEALKIAQIAKESKSNIYDRRKIDILPLQTGEVRRGEETKRVKRSPQGFGESVCKYKLNVSKIEQQIAKEKECEWKLRQKYGAQLKLRRNLLNKSHEQLPVFLTDPSRYCEVESRMFPCLSKSKFGHGLHLSGKQNLKDSRDYTLIIRKLNEIKHENDMLVVKIEQMRKLGFFLGGFDADERGRIQLRLRELQCRKTGLQRAYKSQEELKKKLEVIIKICDLNKMYGSESDYLATYLNNLKYMISIEETKIRDYKSQIHSIIQQGKIKIKALRSTKKQIAKVPHQTVPQAYISLDSQQNKGVGVQLHISEEEVKNMERSLKMGRSKLQKTRVKEYFQNQPQITLIEAGFGLAYGREENQQLLENFFLKIQKQRQLTLKNDQLQAGRQEKLLQLCILRDHLNSSASRSRNQKAIQVRAQIIEKRKLLNQAKERNLLMERSLQSCGLARA